MNEHLANGKNYKETDQLPEAKEQKVETEKPESDLDYFSIESVDYFKSAIFQ